MPTRIPIQVDDARRTAEIDGGQVVVIEAGAAYRIEAGFDGRFTVHGPDGPIELIAAQAGNVVWVAAGDLTLECRVGAAARTAAAVDGDALSAPMPATVTALHVTVGQDVTAGDLLVALEAMKMELTLKAPRDGRVLAIHCEPGALVAPGVPLIDLGAPAVGDAPGTGGR